jgi:hypothetical protein
MSTREEIEAEARFDAEVLPTRKALHLAVGEAIYAYAMMEANQASVLQAILRIKPDLASTIYFAIQNVRTRNEIIQTLLELKYGDRYSKYWKAISKFLQKLAQFRNAIAHWHPVIDIYSDGARMRFEEGLFNPTPGKLFETLKSKHIPNFSADCAYIRGELAAFSQELRRRGGSLPQRFRTPTLRPNLAALQPRPRPTKRKRRSISFSK